MPKCFFVVRATVSDPNQRAAFDRWYRDEHLPQAMQAFAAEKGWRFWSDSDPAVHQASYRFADRATLDRAIDAPSMKTLIAEFDRAWPGIPRSREVFTLAEERDAGG